MAGALDWHRLSAVHVGLKLTARPRAAHKQNRQIQWHWVLRSRKLCDRLPSASQHHTAKPCPAAHFAGPTGRLTKRSWGSSMAIAGQHAHLNGRPFTAYHRPLLGRTLAAFDFGLIEELSIGFRQKNHAYRRIKQHEKCVHDKAKHAYFGKLREKHGP